MQGAPIAICVRAALELYKHIPGEETEHARKS
jgi:hypothetical protein